MQNISSNPDDATATAAPQYPIESVDNALKLLLLLGEQQEIRLTDASNYLAVASSTAHRVLAMLQYRGFVRQDAQTKAYGPGPALTGVAFSVIGRMNINQLGRPFLQELNDVLDETIHLGMLEGANVRFMDGIESRKAVRVASRLGKSLPAHVTSIGKAMLAELDSAELRRLYPNDVLPRVTDKSITDFSRLEKQLALTRSSGYATNREESEEGVASVSVAVPTSVPGLRLALSVSAPVNRLPAKAAKEAASILIPVAKRFGEALG
ncbi:IclR family transcriptional regulator [Subtercola lobariae]|uniref:IclR family transcriptional regulator n=1 Tax=Subtercola lobariae TaxID=1588641 RepID=UPI001E3797B1|nr:IclR family transcriptional regulator [Subtercola lobariae]